MYKKYFTFLFIFVAIAFQKKSIAQEDTLFKQSIDSLAEIQLQKSNGIGFFIGLKEGEFERVYFYGSASHFQNIVPDSNSLFEIGPLSATLTSILYAGMALDGDVGIDDPVQKYLPFDVTAPVYQKIICKPLKDKEGTQGMQDDPSVKFSPYVCLPDENSVPQPILLCYLATHTSGLPSFPHNRRSTKEKGVYNKEDLYDFLRNYHLIEPISYDYRYSELGIALLAHVLSLNQETSFDSLLMDRVLSPLKMNATGSLSGSDSHDELLAGYSTSLKIMPYRPHDLFSAACGLHSSINDMMRFLKANIGEAPEKLKSILDYTHNPRILLVDTKSEDSEIAMGWQLRKLDNKERTAVWQGGSTEGFSSFMGFEESKKRGVVILSNSAAGVESLGFGILKLMNGN